MSYKGQERRPPSEWEGVIPNEEDFNVQPQRDRPIQRPARSEEQIYPEGEDDQLGAGRSRVPLSKEKSIGQTSPQDFSQSGRGPSQTPKPSTQTSSRQQGQQQQQQGIESVEEPERHKLPQLERAQAGKSVQPTGQEDEQQEPDVKPRLSSKIKEDTTDQPKETEQRQTLRDISEPKGTDYLLESEELPTQKGSELETGRVDAAKREPEMPKEGLSKPQGVAGEAIPKEEEVKTIPKEYGREPVKESEQVKLKEPESIEKQPDQTKTEQAPKPTGREGVETKGEVRTTTKVVAGEAIPKEEVKTTPKESDKKSEQVKTGEGKENGPTEKMRQEQIPSSELPKDKEPTMRGQELPTVQEPEQVKANEDKPQESLQEEEKVDTSILFGKVVNKRGYVVGDEGLPIGRLIEGDPKELAGLHCGEEGFVYNNVGKAVGRCKVIPLNERVMRHEGIFAGYTGLKVVDDGKIQDLSGNVVGRILAGDPKLLIGHQVEEDGDIIDKWGNVKGHAEPWQEPEKEKKEVDLSILGGCLINKAGKVVNSSGKVLGCIVEGDPKNMIGCKVDEKGQIWDSVGHVIGRADLVRGMDTKPEGPFFAFQPNTVKEDGTVTILDGTIVGRVVEGDIKKLIGYKVDEDGEITDKHGNVLGKAERWEKEKKKRKINPMSGFRVNREGEIRDESGNVIGQLTQGDLGRCIGLEVDDNGYVVDNDGNRVGEATLKENIKQPEPKPEVQEETEEDKRSREDNELAKKMADICQQALDRVQPVLKQMNEYFDLAFRTPREELDEEELVKNVRPLIEEGGRILQECNGSIRGLDPDGRIAARAKGRTETREATPEEYRLADLLKELTVNVVGAIDRAKKIIADMPHAQKELNPLWSLLMEPLSMIIAAVGLLLAGVLKLVERLLDALGLGGLIRGLLGGLGIDSLLKGLGQGLGSLTEGLGNITGGLLGTKKKSSSKPGGLPIVGDLLGGILGGGS